MLRVLFFVLLVFGHSTLVFSQDTPRSILVEEISVYFDFGKHEIRADALASLNELVPKIIEGDRVHIEAHTDGIGTDADNVKLSEARSNAVKSFLETKRSNSVSINYEGERIPIATNDSDDGRQLNRRARVMVFRTVQPVSSAIEDKDEPRPVSPPKKLKPVPEGISRLSGNVFDMDSGEPVIAQLEITIDEQTKKSTNEKFKLDCPNNSTIKINCYAEGYFYRSLEIPIGTNENLEQSIGLKPIKVGEQVRINNLFFVGDQAVVLPESEPELNRLLRFMDLNSTVKIEIQGHINNPFVPPGRAHPDQVQLSYDRAFMVRQFLIDNGVDKKRMSFKGYGNSRMLFPNARSEEDQRMNRRVEIKVTGT